MATTRTTDEQMNDTFKQIDDALNKIEATPPLGRTPTRAFGPTKKIDNVLADALAEAITMEESLGEVTPSRAVRLVTSKLNVLRLRGV